MDTLRVALKPTKRTDVMCLSCFRFHCERVIVRTDGSETDMGVHNRCEAGVHHKFTRKRRGNEPGIIDAEYEDPRDTLEKLETPC